MISKGNKSSNSSLSVHIHSHFARKRSIFKYISRSIAESTIISYIVWYYNPSYYLISKYSISKAYLVLLIVSLQSCCLLHKGWGLEMLRLTTCENNTRLRIISLTSNCPLPALQLWLGLSSVQWGGCLCVYCNSLCCWMKLSPPQACASSLLMSRTDAASALIQLP